MQASSDLPRFPDLSLIRRGDFRSIARAITVIENTMPGSDALLQNLGNRHAPVIGVTGPPGAGKSTLVDALAKQWVDHDKKLAILCVDPSSAFHSGALLGDRIRMNRWYNHPQVYIRSLASRGAIGGLNPRIFEITDLLANAGFDFILIETVGVGQSEVDIARVADQVVLVLVPESGDDIQTMKSGILEIGDIFVVNKSDRSGASRFLQSLKSSLQFQSGKSFTDLRFLQTVASEEKGIGELYAAIMENIRNISPKQSLDLLAEKAWQLILDRRMRDIDRGLLIQSLKRAMEQPGFNIHRFAAQYKGSTA
ncbi:MAG: methylmalonyl Co-A mutase-associated GTPase MeaB [Bacteroidota bacterium]|nr:methylmalonyl Co-A mutase-associated GTPase MeaB [Bacteroidota bacterium]MDP4212908.1 methylmalonyl Co-A mutase-associated GTPase MeaB [Bacteroidota bacterium]MDP4249888.1 methylmalonyl Co-A mutase-associated GTPase MeaB [Bacteroidota bacterium]